MVCVDNSEWMRNGDFTPTRFEVRPRPHAASPRGVDRTAREGKTAASTDVRTERHGVYRRWYAVHPACTTPVDRALAADRTHGVDSPVGSGRCGSLAKRQYAQQMLTRREQVQRQAQAPSAGEPRRVPRVPRSTRSGEGRRRHGTLAKGMRRNDTDTARSVATERAQRGSPILVGRGRTRLHARVRGSGPLRGQRHASWRYFRRGMAYSATKLYARGRVGSCIGFRSAWASNGHRSGHPAVDCGRAHMCVTCRGLCMPADPGCAGSVDSMDRRAEALSRWLLTAG
jgi:hypothetical protein